MREKTESVTMDDLLEVASKTKEVGDEYKTHSYSLMAHLFGVMAEEVINVFGDKGKETLEGAVRRFGEERGKKVARLVKSLGGELTLNNFFIYGDLSSDALTYVPELDEEGFHIKISSCPFKDGWISTGTEEYGRLYCEHIDKATLRGYNPSLILDVSRLMLKGDDICELIYKNK